MKYDGIFPETLALMAQNRFENSKSFYEEHKQELKDGFTVPLRQIAMALGSKVFALDDMIVTDPVRMVSRIRRDNRYTKDKSLYRDHLWVMFMRNKHEWMNYPCMWFEVNQDCWGYGVGTYYADAQFLELYRKALLERPKEFLDAVHRAENTGAGCLNIYYKKKKPGNPTAEIEPYYNIKSLGYMKVRTDFKTLESEKVIDEVGRAFDEFAGLYLFLKSVADERTMLK